MSLSSVGSDIDQTRLDYTLNIYNRNTAPRIYTLLHLLTLHYTTQCATRATTSLIPANPSTWNPPTNNSSTPSVPSIRTSSPSSCNPTSRPGSRPANTPATMTPASGPTSRCRPRPRSFPPAPPSAADIATPPLASSFPESDGSLAGMSCGDASSSSSSSVAMSDACIACTHSLRFIMSVLSSV